MDLREEINNISIIDGHLHAADTWQWMKGIGSYPFLNLTAKIPVPDKYTTVTRRKALLRCYKEIYGFPYDEVNETNVAELDTLYDESKKDEARYAMIAFDKAGIEKGLQMSMTGVELAPGLDPDRFAVAPLVDGFVIPLDNSGIGTTQRERQFVQMTGYFPGLMRKEMNPVTFDDYLDMVSATLDRIVAQGAAALKMNFAYWRDVAISVVERDEAEDVFKKKDTSPARYRALQDYLLRHLIAKAAVLGLPIHLHVGPCSITKSMESTSPARLDPFLWLPDIKPAKIVLLHGGWPYTRETGFMVGRAGDAPNVYMDVSLMWYFVPGAPEVLVPILRDWILAGLVPRMIYGSDSPSVFGVMLCAINARDALYRTLQGLVNEGTFDEAQALDMATAIFRENAKALYAGKL
jgi:uncharacterized protein